MMEVGNKVFYPMHGAGIIESMEEKEILGETQLYYIVHFPVRDMNVLIPQNKTSNLDMRDLVDADTLDHVLSSFQTDVEEMEMSMNPGQRQRHYMAKLKNGDIHDEAEVIRDLVRLSKNKPLAAEDKTMLNQARQFLISEMVLVKNIEYEEAENWLQKVIFDPS